MRVLIVRPAPGNAATVDAVVAIGLEPIVVPLFEVAPLAWDVPDPDGFDAVVMTSANAARHGGAGLARFTHLPLFAVGEATAEAARGVGFADVCIGAGDARDLAALIKPLPLRGGAGVGTVNGSDASVPADIPHPNPSPQGEGLRFVHFTGIDHRQIPTDANITTIPVYDSRPLTPSARHSADIALIHSPRAGARLAELTPDRAATQIVAISPAAARECGSGWAAIHIADYPREHAMLECLARVCKAGATKR